MKWVKRIPLAVIAALVLAGLAAGGLGYRSLRGSLPALEGTLALKGLDAPVTVARDAAGVATFRGSHRRDLARATGFVHAQERFFQMDLLRRRAAGELAELIGRAALPADRDHRVHRMRARMEARVRELDDAQLALFSAYTEGVNAGLAALTSPPFEYVILRKLPRPWRTEDTLLVISAMFFDLNDASGGYEDTVGLLWDELPAELAAFLSPIGTEWDAPIAGEPFPTPDAPGPQVLSLRSSVIREAASTAAPAFDETFGSNNWAVAGERTAHGGALLANDTHLRHSVPNIWYRAQLVWGAHRVVGVTLPGTPFIALGSNTRVAWGFTNTNGDWLDLVELELDPNDPERYRTPEGWELFETHEERIDVAGAESESLVVRETRWGPVVDADHRGTLRAARWIAHDPGGVNLEMGSLETATTLDEALERAHRLGIPPQNFVVADADGRIAWTVAGRIPQRFGFDGRRPSSWAAGDRGWSGFLASEAYPAVRSPESGLLWTANARVVSGEMLETMGDGGYAFGARARQIRDGLMAVERPSERDMLAIQLDDRAVFLGEWRDYFLEWLERGELHEIIESEWTGRASTDTAAYRLVRELRVAIFEEVFGALTARVREANPQFSVHWLRQWDGPLWKLVQEKPEHLVPAGHENWNAWMKAIVEKSAASFREEGPLAERRWGELRRVEVRHPLSRSLPFVSRWLDMPVRALPGDSHLPRAQGLTSGASQRMVVSPGREEDGLFHMPGGQSGHPLSPYYGAGHADWAEGRPTPLLPGPTRYRLVLEAP